MKGENKVINQLQVLLNGELMARDQYFAHSRMYQDWGLNKLHDRLNHEMEEETGHADVLVERLLFLQAKPDFSNQDKVNIGSTVPEMLANDLKVELTVVETLKTAIKVCEQEQDYDSRAMLIKLLDDTEMDHTWWLEKQLGLIEKVGLQNYLQSQM